MSKNFSQRTTAAIDNATIYVRAAHSQLRPQHIYLLLWTALFLYLGLMGCDSRTTNSSERSSESVKVYSRTQTSSVSRPAYTYQAQEDLSLPEAKTPPKSLGSAKIDRKRLVTLAGVIDEQMFNKANEITSLAEQDDDDIDLLISSPGGSISHGLLFIHAMEDVKAKGIKIRCFVPTLAASMAYVIFTQCDERYALPYAALLFHPPRIGGTFLITAPGARELAQGLTQLEIVLLKLMLPAMGVDPSHGLMWFQTAYMQERLFLASDLADESPAKWLQVVGAINGYPGQFPAPYTGQGPTGNKSLKAPSIQEVGR